LDSVFNVVGDMFNPVRGSHQNVLSLK